MQIEQREAKDEQFRVDLGGEAATVYGRQQRSSGLALAMLVERPAQHEVADQLATLTRLHRDGQHVLVSHFGWQRDLSLQDGARRLSIADVPVEVTRDALVAVDRKEPVEVAVLETSQGESVRRD